MESNMRDYISEQLDKVVSFINPLLPLANSHLVYFFTEDQFDVLLPAKIKKDLLELDETDVDLIPTARLFDDLREPNFRTQFQDMDLREFLSGVRWLHLDKLNILSQSTTLSVDSVMKEEQNLLQKVMKQKKVHEVSRLGNIVMNVCKENDIDWIVDIGCGLGYLSSYLHVFHKQRVLAMDSSSSNVSSALKICKKLHELRIKSVNSSRRKNAKLSENSEPKTSERSLNGYSQVLCPESDQKIKDSIDKDDCKEGSGFTAFNSSFLGITKFIRSDENISDLLNSKLHTFEDSDNEGLEGNKLAIVGLHTCGNLSPTAIRLFHSNKNVKALCHVSCCYHLLEEEFVNDEILIHKFRGSSSISNINQDNRYHLPELDPFHSRSTQGVHKGFPLSTKLKNMKFCLGKNIRDLASKPTSRLTLKDEKSLKILFWRAVLQAIVVRIRGSWPEDAFVGRSASKKCSFVEYCRVAFEQIGIDAEIKITDDGILELYEEYKSKEKELILFYFLKTSLGPLIENIIHLDRLLYLHELGYTRSHLMKVFDDFVSPRCLALVAFK